MCFGGGGDSSPAPTPAPAPDQPSATQATQTIGGARQSQDTTNYGTSTPSLYRDNSNLAGGITAGGAGLGIKGM